MRAWIRDYTSRVILPFSAVAAMLRLGTKYDFNHLRTEALYRLRAEFPSTLQEWEFLPSEYTHMQNQGGILFDIVNLALEQGLFSILPVAYYLCIQDIVGCYYYQSSTHCLKDTQDEIFNGQKRDDGTLATLPPAVQRVCVLGREKILVEQADATLAWLDNEEVSGECENSLECARVCTNLVSWVWKPMPEPCRSLEKWSMIPKDRLCLACIEEASKIHEAGRQKMWDMMPLNFGFPAWDELKKLDR